MKQSFYLPSVLLFAPFVLLAHGGTIKGLVVDAQTNTELPGATVRIDNPPLATATNELGIFSFHDLPGGSYTLSITLVGYEAQTRTVQITDHETTDIKFELLPGGLSLADVEIAAPKSRPLTSLGQVDIRTRPLQSAQDVLRFVPGLFIG